MLFIIEIHKNNDYKIDITCFIEKKLFRQIH